MERTRLDSMQQELDSPFSEGLSTDEVSLAITRRFSTLRPPLTASAIPQVKQRESLQNEVGALKKARPAAEREAARAEQKQSALETELGEHLQKRQRELEAILGELAMAPRTSQETVADSLTNAQESSVFAAAEPWMAEHSADKFVLAYPGEAGGN